MQETPLIISENNLLTYLLIYITYFALHYFFCSNIMRKLIDFIH